MKSRFFLAAAAVAIYSMSAFVSADEATMQPAEAVKPVTTSPEVVVETLTSELLDLAKNGQQKLKDDPDAFYSDVEQILDPMVGFEFIAMNVMGGRSLRTETNYERATPEQRKQFLAVFKRSLVETYVKGMSQNLDYKVEILADESQTLKSSAKIVQKISGPNSSTMVVYSMGLGKSGQWKVINVVLDGVNLGKTFRSQFAQGIKSNNGDIAATIAGWSGKN